MTSLLDSLAFKPGEIKEAATNAFDKIKAACPVEIPQGAGEIYEAGFLEGALWMYMESQKRALEAVKTVVLLTSETGEAN